MSEREASGVREARLTREEAAARAARVGDVSYRLHFELEAEAAEFRGESEVRFASRPGEGEVFLDFVADELDRLVLNGSELDASLHDGARLHLPEELLRSEGNLLEVAYRSAHARTCTGFYRFRDPADGGECMYTSSEPFDANRFMPCFDQPDIKATYTLDVDAPAGWEVASNVLSTRVDRRGERRLHVFPESERFSTYLFALAAGDLAVVEDLGYRYPLRVLGRRSLQESLERDAQGVFAATRAEIDFYERYFGVPFPFSKYDHVFCPDFFAGAMENPGMIVVADSRYLPRHQPSAEERRERDMVVLHELAHQWFGNLVTLRWWDGLWLNESFATYMSFVALLEAMDYPETWTYFDDKMRRWALWQDQLPTTHPIELEVPDTAEVMTNFDGIAYGKGCCVLRQLAFRLGDETFRQGVEDYLKRHAWGNTSRADFTDALGKAAGLDLSPWVEDWLYRAGVDVVEPVLEVEGGRIRRLTLRQRVGSGEDVLRYHRLRLGFFERGEEGIRLERTLDVTISGEETVVSEAAGLPAPALLHPNHESEGYVKVVLDEASLATVGRSLGEVVDPAVRASLLDVCHDMVQDVHLSAPAFLRLALRVLPEETRAPVLEKLSSSVPGMLGRYLEPGRREEVADPFHELARERLAAGGLDEGDRDLWFRLLWASAFGDEALDRLGRLLDGEESYPELEVDQHRRWRLLRRLLRLRGRTELSRLEAEVACDGTDEGRREALAARAAMPDAEVKAEVWRRFLEDRESAAELLKVGFAAFHQPDQEEVLAPYARRYLEALDEVVAREPTKFATDFAKLLFPSCHPDEAFVERVRARVEEERDPPVIRRVLLEAADDLSRSLRIRARAREDLAERS